MTFFCDSCRKDREFFGDYGMIVITVDSEIKYICRHCRKPQAAIPDVYFDGKPEENLADDPNTGEPRVFFSKAEKAAYLKERGLQEAGDRVHGAPVQLHENQIRKTDSRHEVMMALKRVKEMGRDRRRQEYLKIVKEGQRHAR